MISSFAELFQVVMMARVIPTAPSNEHEIYSLWSYRILKGQI